MKTCPYCIGRLDDAAVKCRYCGEWIDPSAAPVRSAPRIPRRTECRSFVAVPFVFLIFLFPYWIVAVVIRWVLNRIWQLLFRKDLLPEEVPNLW